MENKITDKSVSSDVSVSNVRVNESGLSTTKKVAITAGAVVTVGLAAYVGYVFGQCAATEVVFD